MNSTLVFTNIALVIVNLVLVVITAWYAISTYRLLRESRRTGADIKRLAEAAEASVRTVREQIQAQSEARLMVIRTTIRTALRTVEYWKEHNVPSLAAQHALPRRIEPVPETASQAIEYARALSVTAANHLSRGFDGLREAAVEMETMREAKSIPPDFYAVAARKISGFLESAQQALEKAEAELPPA